MRDMREVKVKIQHQVQQWAKGQEIVIIARADEKLIGTIKIQETDTPFHYLTYLYVDQEYRNGKIATNLVEYATNLSDKLNAKAIRATIPKENTFSSGKICKRLGFSEYAKDDDDKNYYVIKLFNREDK